jgi:hypothetical protein
LGFCEGHPVYLGKERMKRDERREERTVVICLEIG